MLFDNVFLTHRCHRLILDVRNLLSVSVAYDEASVVEFPFDAQRSLCDAPIDMRLCGPGLRKPSDRPVLTAALRCLKLYVFELMANASFI